MKKEYKIIIITISIVLIVLIHIGAFSYYKYYNKSKNKEKKDNKVIKVEEKPIEKQVIEPYINELPIFREQYQNNNIMGRLEINDIGINTFVTRSEDNSFYLNNNIYNQYDGLGVPFFDFRNKDLDKDRQINIYGHNTENIQYQDHLPFIKLISYKNIEVFNNNKTINLYTDNNKKTYEVIAIKIITKDNIEHMQLSFQNDEDFLNHTNRLLENTTYQDNIEITGKDKLLVLQVCNYDPPNTFLLVIAKLKT